MADFYEEQQNSAKALECLTRAAELGDAARYEARIKALKSGN